MSLTNPNKPVTEARLQEFYHRIKSYLGFTEMPSEDMSEVISPLPSIQPRYHKYSTEEHIVGEWIDGKPIYEKVLRPSSDITITTSMTNIHDVSDLNIETLVEGAVHRFPNQGTSMLETDYDSGYIRAKALGVNLPYYTNGFTVIQYTKTTD